MLTEIRHVTRYSYGHPVDHSLQRLRLTPGSSPAQEVLSWSISMPAEISRYSRAKVDGKG
jgi:hypothetical protein